MTNSSSRRWYVVQTQPHAETKAVAHLIQQGFETYLPRYRKRRSHARRVDQVAAPLFPRYFFVAINMATQRWRSIQSTFGVTRLVCNGDFPASVPQRIIDGIKAQEDAEGYVRLASRTEFKPGASVRILDGAFESCCGLFEGIADNERVAILLDLLGRKVRVLLNTASIAAA